MTTEIAIMNRTAVALAADSAVSVSGGGGLKVYDGVNKLFELIRGRPVGVMIYNAAELSFRPWETVIKSYREERRASSFATLDAYVADFKDFIRNHRELFSVRQQDEALEQIFQRDLQQLRAWIVNELKPAIESGQVSARRITMAVNRTVSGYWEFARSQYALDQWDSALPSRRRLGELLRKMLDDNVDRVFESMPISDSVRAKLRVALIHRSFGYAEDDDFSGVVFAGFGDDEYYPRLREFRVKGILASHLLSRDEPSSRTDIDVRNPGDIKSFAQGDMIRSFTDGIQDQVRGEMLRFWSTWRRGDVGGEVTADARLTHLRADDLDVIRDVVNEKSSEAVTGFMNHMAHYERVAVKGPLLQSVAFLPKDELGAMAESLVNLTTLKRRVSINEAQTVGGAVDVAIVSRGDGFVWLKRKHYFDEKYNPSWASSHAATPIASKG